MRSKVFRTVSMFLAMLFAVTSDSEEIPSDFKFEMNQYYLQFFCDDSAFIECIDLSRSGCISSVSEALNSCDITLVWESANSDTLSQVSEDTRKASLEYGECINKEIFEKIGVKREKYDRCIINRLTKHANLLKAERDDGVTNE